LSDDISILLNLEEGVQITMSRGFAFCNFVISEIKTENKPENIFTSFVAHVYRCVTGCLHAPDYDRVLITAL
jgi:hypothetical protein